MGYANLNRIVNITDEETRLKTFSNYYRNREINGLYYVNFIPDSNTISISLPDHSTHHDSTAYLIIKKSTCSINTVKNQANDIKKFLDFLLIWDLDILKGDLYVIILGFIDYLRCIKSEKKYSKRSILNAIISKIPLHEQSLSLGHTISIGYSRDGFMKRKNWSDLQYSTIKQTLSSTILFLSFLKERSSHYKGLKLNQLPKRLKHKETMLSGTLGPLPTIVLDLDLMLSSVGLKPDNSKQNLLINQKIFTIQEMDTFLNFIPNNHYQNKLLFYVLKFFGLRIGELANLMIDTTTLPKNLLYMEHFEAREYLKNNLKGDLEYSQVINRWVCYVIQRENQDYRSQHKSGSREIPLLFSGELFLDLLLNALKEREILMRYCKIKHSYLFVSRHNILKGNPINGKTIASRYSQYANKLLKQKNINLTRYSPHSFRHFFATYLLRINNENINDVSRWLGHSDTEITRSTYSHYIPNEDANKNIVIDMAQKFNFEEI